MQGKPVMVRATWQARPLWYRAIRDIIVNELPDDAGPTGWQIPVSVIGHGAQAANISRVDIRQIPTAVRTEACVADALDQTCEFINNPVHWWIISELALELD
jgi:hypothetical protein